MNECVHTKGEDGEGANAFGNCKIVKSGDAAQVHVP